MSQPRLAAIVREHQEQILADWSVNLTAGRAKRDLISDAELQRQAREFLSGMEQALDTGNDDVRSAPWEGVRELLSRISRSRAQQGFRPSDTAMFVFSVKEPLFRRIRLHAGSADAVAEDTWAASAVLDELGMFTTEIFQKSREEIIVRQQQEMLELSTPVVTRWDGIRALPLIGTLDSATIEEGDDLVVRVDDSGSGIDAEFLPLVFEQFRQGEAGMSRKHGGLRLGLAARTRRGRGAGVPAPALGGLKVLPADGEATSELSVTLAAAGGVVEAAHGVDEVLRLLPESAWDVLVLSPPLATEAVAEATDRRGCHPLLAPIRPTEPPAALVRRLNRAVRSYA